MFKKTKVCKAVLAACGGIVALTAMPAATYAQDRVEITGSRIKRVQTEGATPIVTIGAVEIERVGAQTVGELLRSNAAMALDDDGSFSLLSSYSGFQGAGMSGFGNSDTLVLINGRRVARYPVGGDSVDVNSIPISAVERIEILRDGASAIYGSDAIAGVVNVITKREFQGVSVGLTGGRSSRGDGDKYRANVVAGFGDLGKSGFNVLAGLEVGKTGKIFNRDRDFTKSADLRSYGLADDRLPTSPDVNIEFDDGSPWRPASTCSAPLPAGGVAVPNITDPNGGLVCPFDPNTTTLLQPEVKEMGWFAQLTAQFSGMTSRTEIFYKKKESGNFLNPQPIALGMPATDPLNVLGKDLFWYYRSTDPRLFRQTDIEVDASRFVTELSGTVGKFDWSVDFTKGKSGYQQRGGGYFERAPFIALLNSGTLNPFDKTTLAPEILIPLTRNPVRLADTDNSAVSAKLSGALGKLGGGDVLFAAGIGHGKDSYEAKPDPLQLSGSLLGDPRLSATQGERKNSFGFGEIVAPITKTLEIGAAVRYDRYNTFGGTTNPKLNVRFQPNDLVLLRGSVGRGFKAPDLEDLFASASSGFPNVRDTQRCIEQNISPCPSRQIFTETRSNPDLKPEKSNSFTLGVVVSPVSGLNMSVDYIRIKKEDEIGALAAQTILDNPSVPVAGYGLARDLVRRTSSGNIDPSTSVPAIIAPTANIGSSDNEVLGVNVSYATRVAGLSVRLQNDTNFLLSRKSSGLPGLPLEEYRGLAGYAKWRNVFAASASTGPWDFSGYLRTISGFTDTDTPSSVLPTTRKVPSWTTVDLGVGYSGLFSKGTKLNFQIKNVFDRDPPLSETRNTSNKIDFVHNGVGRYFQAGVQVDF